jgi:hypothetical protein
MNRVVLKDIPLRINRFSRWAPRIHRVLFGLFLLQFALVWTRLWLPWPLLGSARWPDGLLVVLTTATVVASLTRQLPGQNVMLASTIIAFIAGAVQSLGALTAIPFGTYAYTEQIGQQLFYPLPWAVPLMWIAVILASRGVARLTLRPWRRTQNYGFRLIGLTTLLVVLLDAGLEPFATSVKHYLQVSVPTIDTNQPPAPLSPQTTRGSSHAFGLQPSDRALRLTPKLADGESRPEKEDGARVGTIVWKGEAKYRGRQLTHLPEEAFQRRVVLEPKPLRLRVGRELGFPCLHTLQRFKNRFSHDLADSDHEQFLRRVGRGRRGPWNPRLLVGLENKQGRNRSVALLESGHDRFHNLGDLTPRGPLRNGQDWYLDLFHTNLNFQRSVTLPPPFIHGTPTGWR